jgi:hypothetical protein
MLSQSPPSIRSSAQVPSSIFPRLPISAIGFTARGISRFASIVLSTIQPSASFILPAPADRVCRMSTGVPAAAVSSRMKPKQAGTRNSSSLSRRPARL